jgi:ADP-ribosylglycohydrolase
VFRARRGASKDDIRSELAARFGYVLDRTVVEIRADYALDVLGGDSDTQAAIAGGIAQAFYRAVPDSIIEGARVRLP